MKICEDNGNEVEVGNKLFEKWKAMSREERLPFSRQADKVNSAYEKLLREESEIQWRRHVLIILSDISGREPLYRKAYEYFSKPVAKDLLTCIKNDNSVLPRIGALREAFITDHERALEELFVENAEKSRKFDECLNINGTRVATVFASLKSFPNCGASICVSRDTEKDGKGYFEDRKPASNMDPYVVTSMIAETTIIGKQ
ncbi:hypothetical protein CASFOL_031779 [Castilleja foliolosa]|uniref:Uncharacterized protein n=1 Tax=Castilleja foliolosa TaxID=1961234 RepID=A0ABD3C704_9LAMI